MMLRRCVLAFGLILLTAWSSRIAPAHAREAAAAIDVEFAVASPFSDHMVLQRDTSARAWGWAPPGTVVEVTFGGKTVKGAAMETGRWEALIGPLEASAEPQSMTVVAGDETVEFADVLVGEVWIASGQSNMEWRVENAANPDEEIAQANWPQIRLLDIPHNVAETPQDKVENPGWKVCSPETVRTFSAVGYYFARELHKELDVPVGVVSVNWGGTSMEAWTSRDALSDTETFASVIDDLKPLDEMPEDQRGTPHRAGVLFNGMLAPMIPYGIRGAIWYQGESNAGRAAQYRELSETMINDWRRRWKEGDFPFLLVQLAGWEPGGDSWPYLREAQHQTLDAPNTGMAVATDIGNRKDIHPKNKQEVGRRLALAALAIAYDKDVKYQGPTYRDMQIDGAEVTVQFEHAAGLKHDGQALQGFALAGPDGEFHAAEARIEGESVVVTSEEVQDPAAVRYNWAAYPEGTLRNEAGLPAPPFRTDQW